MHKHNFFVSQYVKSVLRKNYGDIIQRYEERIEDFIATIKNIKVFCYGVLCIHLHTGIMRYGHWPDNADSGLKRIYILSFGSFSLYLARFFFSSRTIIKREVATVILKRSLLIITISMETAESNK